MLFSGFTPRFFISLIYKLCAHTKTINMFLECYKSEMCSDFFHHLKTWKRWAAWEWQRTHSRLPMQLQNGLKLFSTLIFSLIYIAHLINCSKLTRIVKAVKVFFLFLVVWIRRFCFVFSILYKSRADMILTLSSNADLQVFFYLQVSKKLQETFFFFSFMHLYVATL